MVKKELKQYYHICPECSYFKVEEQNLEIKYCSRCGHKFKRCCRKCQLKFDDPFAKFCGRCGEKILVSSK